MIRVAIVGPGRVGGALALGLQHAGHEVVQVAGRGQAALDRFTTLIPGALIVDLDHVTVDVELVMLTAPDDVLSDIARRIAVADRVTEGQRFVHTAGGLGLDPLRVLQAAGGRVAACHPAMTFPDPSRGAENLPGTSWAVTAEPDDLGWARLLVLDLRGSPVTLAAGDRTLYHAGLAVGGNGTTAVVSMARDMLLGAGIEDPSAFLTPLVTASAEGGAADGVAALTGPVMRGDDGTIRRHLEELRTSFPEAVQTYVALGDLILAQALRAGLDPERGRAVEAALDSVRGMR